MRILRLNFNQQIWLGFGIIIFLLSVSSMLALYNLNVISSSTNQVNDTAVPVLKQSNKVQITLLKQAKLSASGYNATNVAKITEVNMNFRQGGQTYRKQVEALMKTAEAHPQMKAYLSDADKAYAEYAKAVESMFQAKTEILTAAEAAENELRALSNLVDDAGALLLDVVWNEYGDDDQSREQMEGIQGRLDGLIIGLFNMSEETFRSTDLQRLQESKQSVHDAISNIRARNKHAESVLADLKGRQTWQDYLQKLEEFEQRATGENSLTDHKIKQLQQIARAREELDKSEEAVQKVVALYDQLLIDADKLFNEQQSGVMDAVSLGSKTAVFAWIILLALATQNFNSMRKSIKKKMADLAKLNSTGETLASLLDQNKALEEVLAAMHDQVGVANGSVYLLNEEEELEVRAFYPPKQVDKTTKPARFKIGEGILGKAAERKKIKFVPDTSQEKAFIAADGEKTKPAQPKALLCVPLVDKDVLIGVMNFSGDVSQVRFEDSDYEFASSIARLLVTTIKNIRMRETIEEQNRTLEQKVRERTAELRQKNKDIEVMLANMAQGLLTITEGGVIHPEYSKHLETILGTSQIANHNFIDLIFKRSNLGADQIDQVATAVDALIGADEMMYDFNAHLLVNELILETEQQHKILELDWVPIVNAETDEIEKLLLTIRDVTELRALQEEAESQKRELEIIGQILSVDQQKFEEFLSSSYRFINESRDLIEKAEQKDPEVVARLFRNMHTVKGNARTYGFNYLTDSVHQVENTYDEHRKDADKPWQRTELLEQLAMAEEHIRAYETIGREKLGLLSGDKQGAQLDSEVISELLDEIGTFNQGTGDPQMDSWLDKTCRLLATSRAVPLSSALEGVVKSAHSLAGELGKPAPEIAIDDGGIYFKNEARQALNDVFMHVIRNSVDHGIESAEERTAAGKPASGHIRISASESETALVIEVSDDGRGLALKKILDKAKENQLVKDDTSVSDEAIIQFIFESGMSTAEKVSEISGRGVGMDAVRAFLQDQGGNIELILTGGKSGDAYRPFKTVISLPLSLALKLPAFVVKG